MHRSSNIVKRFALSRCPAPALGKGFVKDSTQTVDCFNQANLANCCRKLYTRLISSNKDRLDDIRQALITTGRRDKMTLVKLTCSLKEDVNKIPGVVSDYLNMPLNKCFDIKPCPIICDEGPFSPESANINTNNNEPNIDAVKQNKMPNSFRSKYAHMQNLRITGREDPEPF